MANFGTRLRKLRKENNLRQKDLAEILNLAQTTIANYEKNARFPNQETLNDIADYFNISLDYLLGRSNQRVFPDKNNSNALTNILNKEHFIDNNKLAKKYFEYILKGQKTKAIDLILAKIKKEKSIIDIYLEVFEPTMKKVGLLWEKGKLSIDKEHYFSYVTLDIMAQLHNYFPDIKSKKYTIIGTTVPGEKHNIGLKMLMNIFELQGWEAYYYGTNTPNLNIVNAIEENNANIIALSATMPYNINNLQNTIEVIRNKVDKDKLKIIVGGRAFKYDKKLEKKIGADGFAENAKKAVTMAEKLMKT